MVATNFEVVGVVEDVRTAVAVERLIETRIDDQRDDIHVVQIVKAVLEFAAEQIEVDQAFGVSRLNASFARIAQ